MDLQVEVPEVPHDEKENEGITTVDKLLFNISETHYYKCGGRHGQKVQLEKQTSTQEGEHIENTLETETDMRSTWQNNRPQI